MRLASAAQSQASARSSGLRVVRGPEESGRRDLLLTGLTFASGAVDAIAFLGLGKVFSAFMTGNLVFLGLGLAGSAQPDLPRVASALVPFALGVFAAARIVRPTRDTGLWPARVSVALGLALVAQAAFLSGWLVTSGLPSARAGDLLIGLSALAMGLQSGAVMSLDVKGVFTAAATATVIMLAADAAGWPQSAEDRRRYAAVLVGLVAGAAAGAALLLHARVYAPILPLVATAAVLVAARATLGAAE
jgi:uncharacterized membrane protein YoaK (UPF0700 family)